MQEVIFNKYNEWKNYKLADSDLTIELDSIKESETEINDRFYRELEFGTGGLRGVLGVGTNRMNIYTVAKATQGYSNYLKKLILTPSVAIAYDSRIKSDLFARKAAEVFAANGIHVYIYPKLMPTPSLSFAVRYLKCAGGIVVTASHNPSKYNGYKVYGNDGCQITTEVAANILAEIDTLKIFENVNSVSFEEALLQGKISYIDENVVSAYLKAVSDQKLCGDEIDKSISIVYTPLNGSGLMCVKRVLKENGFTNISVVEEQEKPDGNFPTCPYPNPEMKEALELGLKKAIKTGSDLLLATDPDCDRVGVAVRNNEEYVLLSGNEVGMLLFNYICTRRNAIGKMPKNPVLVKTIVTTDMVQKIARDYGVNVVNVLTGFKFIGEHIGQLEANGQEESFILGFEESYGYLTGGYVRDKDAVVGSLIICEMLAYYKTQGYTLVDVLDELYKKYGYCLNTLHSYTFEGSEGFQKMQTIMGKLRKNSLWKFKIRNIIKVEDYLRGINDLPKSDVLKYLLDGGASIVIRPSGTEPKLKVYISVSAENKTEAETLEAKFINEFEQILE